MTSATEGGHVTCIELACGWGFGLATDYDRAMVCAARGGHVACMKLTKIWGAIGFDLAMAYAAKGGHEACMELTKSWGATDYDNLHKIIITGQERMQLPFDVQMRHRGCRTRTSRTAS